MTFSIISLLAGAVLGQRFKVLVLLPAIAFVLLMAIGLGIANAQGLWATTLLSTIAIVSLQIGYLAGIGLRSVLAPSRSGSQFVPFYGAQPVSLNAGILRFRTRSVTAERLCRSAGADRRND
jgi:hypothetical protein